MLRAITSQQQSDYPRLWFSDENHDLFIWLDHEQNPYAFQYSYNKLHDEHCIHWHQQRGYGHDHVDSGESPDHRYKMTPILVPDGHVDQHQLAKDFLAISEDIDPGLTIFVYQKLRDYPGD